MDRISVEIAEDIIRSLDDDSLKSIRLVCKSLQAISHKIFRQTFFTTRRHLIESNSLHDLLAVSSSHFARQIEKIDFIFAGNDLFAELAGRRTIDTARQIFRNLETPDQPPRRLSLRIGVSSSLVPDSTEGISGAMCSIFSALANARLAVVQLTVGSCPDVETRETDWGISPADFDQPHEVLSDYNWPYLESVELVFRRDQWSARQSHILAIAFLSAKSLHTLSIAGHPTGTNQAYHQLERFGTAFILHRIRNLHISRFTCHENTYRRLVCRLRGSLHHLTLSTCNVNDHGDWRDVLRYIGQNVSELVGIHIQDLSRGDNSLEVLQTRKKERTIKVECATNLKFREALYIVEESLTYCESTRSEFDRARLQERNSWVITEVGSCQTTDSAAVLQAGLNQVHVLIPADPCLLLPSLEDGDTEEGDEQGGDEEGNDG